MISDIITLCLEIEKKELKMCMGVGRHAWASMHVEVNSRESVLSFHNGSKSSYPLDSCLLQIDLF